MWLPGIKPTVPVKINTEGLIRPPKYTYYPVTSGIIAHGNFIGEVPGVPTTEGTDEGLEVTPKGIGQKFDTDSIVANGFLDGGIPMDEGWSFLMVMQSSGALNDDATGDVLLCSTRVGASTPRGYFIQMEGSQGMYTNTTGTSRYSGLDHKNGEWQVYAGTLKGGRQILAQNGILGTEWTDAAVGTWTTFTLGSLAGADQAKNRINNTVMLMFCFWRGSLTNKELISLTVDPYQVLIPK